MKTIAQIIIALAIVIVIQYLLVKYGEPQSTWIYCDVIGLCDSKEPQ